tara:strand:- start:2595 stop:2798 length:204 start_codon:yes stop_codon:yes gene_type:complete
MNPKITLYLNSPKNKLGIKTDRKSGEIMAHNLVSHLRENQFKIMTDEQIDAFVDVLIKEFDIKNRLL